MSATKVFFMLAIRLFVSYGLNIDVKRELFYHGRDLFCAQLQCTENIREDTQISALVNMSVYVINQPGEKLMLATISGSDSKARDYKVPGVFVDGKISNHGGKMHLFLSNDSACHEKTLKCEIYFTYKTGENGFAEEETAPLRKENMRKSDLMLSLKAKTVNYVKTVDTMADFLKSFEDPDKLKGADMTMSLQMSHSSSDIFSVKDFTENRKQIESANDLQNLDTRFNNMTEQLKFVNARFNDLKYIFFNRTEQNTEKERNTNSLFWTQEMCKRTHNFTLASRQLVQLNQTKLTLCDTKTDDGGWILIQRRVVGDVNFTRGWDDYKHGFGSTAGDFWLGNDWISWLTHVGYTDLRIDLTIESMHYYAVYNNFKVDNESSNYFMTFSKYQGNATDNLRPHNNTKFTTTDNDNDADSRRNCAQSFMGGWWYTNCYQTNLNGVWNVNDNTGIFWSGYAKSVEMKLHTL